MNRTTTFPPTKQVDQLTSFEKGQQFEEYVIKLFNERSFGLANWRKSNKIPDGNYSSELSYPDLELVFKGKRNHPFAVECKWRKNFWQEKITWATDYQIKKYLEFQNQNGYRVFIAIGVGGEACNPERLFVTPLDTICHSTFISESDLLIYNRKPTRKFFLDTAQGKLF